MHDQTMIAVADVPVIEAEGQRVVTLAMVDQIHGRPEGTAYRNFKANLDRFAEGEEYFLRNSSEAESMGFTAPRGLTLLTESGYLLLVKSFTDDLAWTIQKRLVATYFRAKAAPAFDPGNPVAVRTLLLDYTERLIAAEATIQQQAPKVAFCEAVTEATNCQTIEEVAKILGIGSRRLFALMRSNGLLTKSNLPYQKHIDAGYFRVREGQYRDPNGNSRTWARTLVTGRGFPYIHERLKPQLMSLARCA
jgi:phage antirepressor YoqD-like protein